LNSYNIYGTDPRTAEPSLDVLIRAIEVASDPVPRTGMGRAVLLLTPPPTEAGETTLSSIISIANQEGVRIFVWMISSPEFFMSEGATRLADMADQTRGSFYAFSGVEDFPDIDDYLEPLRYVYEFSYESKIRTGEPHQVYAQATIGDQKIESQPQNLGIRVNPPNPIFLSPPVEIIRANTAPFIDSIAEDPGYTPEEQVLEILVEFPDDHQRALTRSTLYVDGVIKDENLSEPFKVFTWDLREYTSSANHHLQVELEDSLGLKSYSIEHRIKIIIKRTPQSVISSMARNAPLIAGVSAAVAGGILVLVLIVGGHIQPKDFGHRRKKSSKRAKIQDFVDESQPDDGFLGTAPQKQRMPKWLNKIAWAHWDTPAPQPVAYLDPFNDTAKHTLKTSIPLPIGEVSFGRDPTRAKIALKELALEKLHTKFIVSEDENFTIFDVGTTAGTWVNYQPISENGTTVSHGDIIHMGPLGFRLNYEDKTRIPKAVVIPADRSSVE